ncbi:MAG: helix-turn-helix domain-containing protein, partial [Flavobacterium sp.]|nr:helix-turn-helix domain-containing protein [Flavobacterium sp.]
LEKVYADFKNHNLTLVEDVNMINKYESKSKDKKETKKPTAQVTYELWIDKHTIDQIAEIRKLTAATIFGHFIKLVQDKALAINEVLSADKIEALSEIFKNYTNESLNPLKEQVGDTFTWDELKIFKASISA